MHACLKISPVTGSIAKWSLSLSRHQCVILTEFFTEFFTFDMQKCVSIDTHELWEMPCFCSLAVLFVGVITSDLNVRSNICCSNERRRNVTCSVAYEENINASIDELKIEMTRTTSSMWHGDDGSEEKRRCQLTFIFYFILWKCHRTLWIWSWTSNENCQICTLCVRSITRLMSCIHRSCSRLESNASRWWNPRASYWIWSRGSWTQLISLSSVMSLSYIVTK